MVTSKSQNSFGARLNAMLFSPLMPISDGDLRDARLVSALALVTVVSMLMRMSFGIELSILVGFFAVIVAYGLGRTPYWKIAGLIIVVLLATPSLINLASTTPEVNADLGDWALARLSWLALPMMLASVFFSWRGSLLYGLGLMGACFLASTLNPVLAPSDIIGAFAIVGVLTALILLAVHHRDMVERDRQAQLIQTNEALLETQNTLEERVKTRTLELESVNQELNNLNANLEERIEERIAELHLSQSELQASQDALQQEKNRVRNMYTTIDVLLKQLRSVFNHRPSREELSSYMTVLEVEYEKLSGYFDN